MPIRPLRRMRQAAGFALAVSVLVPAAATADTRDINNIQLGSSYGALAGGTTWTTTPGQSGNVDFRWIDGAGKSTTITANDCQSGSVLGETNFGSNVTSYRQVWNGPPYACFFLRGRTQPGQGAMANPHDGRVRF